MKRINTVMILGIITILEIVGDTIVGLNSDIILDLNLDSVSLWFFYGIYKVFLSDGVSIEYESESDNKKTTGS